MNDRIQAVDVMEMTRAAIAANASQMVTLQRRQMEEGVRSDGEMIAPLYRSVLYAMGKKQLYGSKAPYRVPDLKLTGAFHRGIVFEVDDNNYYFYSTDEKAPDLTDKYEKIMGLTDENKEVAKVINTRQLSRMYKEATGLKG